MQVNDDSGIGNGMMSRLREKFTSANDALDGARTESAGRRVTALGALLVLLLTGAGAAWSLRPPQPRSASAAASQFSAARATALLGGIASVPHPAGSPEAAGVRAFLVDKLRELGLTPDVQTRVATRTQTDDRPLIATVSNVHAKIAGSRPTGRVLLVAHYDSVPTGPGASDNGANVAVILEVVRILRTETPQRNDVDVLFTDAEEAGLLGAQAFVDSGAAGDPRRVVVLNLEARGISGPAVMFEMAGTGLAPAVRAADPVTTSFAAAIYRILPNETDLTVFREGGMRGLNFAFMEGAAHYHTPHDDIKHINGGSVQHMGESTLAAVRYLVATDMEAGGSGATYFSVFGTVISYPAWLTMPLAVMVLATYVLLLWMGRRRGLRLRGVGRAVCTFSVMLPAVAVVGIGGWWLLTLLRPEFQLGFGGIYRAYLYVVSEAAGLLVTLVMWYRWARRKASVEEVAAGVLGWFVLIMVVLAVLLPGGAYLFTWPALAGVTVLMAALRFTASGSMVRKLAGSAAAVPGMALILPIALLLLPALGLPSSAAPLLLVVLLAAVTTGVMEPLAHPRALTTGMMVVVIMAAGTAVIGESVDGYDGRRPQAVSLGYVWEADSGTASWVSAGGPDQPQIGRLLTAGRPDLSDRVPPLDGWVSSAGPAPTADLPSLMIQKLTDYDRDGFRTIQVEIAVPDGAYLMDVYADSVAHQIVNATVDGVSIAGGHNMPKQAGPWKWGLRYAAPPRSGIHLMLRAQGAGPVRIRVVSTIPGLPGGIGAPILGPAVSWTSWPLLPAQTLVVKTFVL